MNDLNKNQKACIEEYMKNGMNGTKAYMKIYKIDDENKAAASFSRLLTNVKVDNYIKSLQGELKEKALVTAEEIINEIRASAFLNIKDLYNEKGELKEINELSDETGKAISSIKVQQRAGAMKISPNAKDEAPLERLDEWVKEIKMNDKLKALELLGKYVGIFKEEKNPINIGDVTIRVELIDE